MLIEGIEGIAINENSNIDGLNRSTEFMRELHRMRILRITQCLHERIFLSFHEVGPSAPCDSRLTTTIMSTSLDVMH